jgi:quinate/shikimate dehydrogenase (NAD+)
MTTNGHQSSRTVRLGLIGAGIEESLSPALHEREAEALGLRCSYELFDLDALSQPPEAIGALLADTRDRGLAGVNVTHPCKQLVVRHLDALSSEAEALGAVNTVVFDDGRMTGHNTDWPGFAEGFRRGLPGADLGQVVLLGAGGAGAAVAHATLGLGAGRLIVVDEEAGRAEELVAALGPRAAAAEVGDLPTVLARADGLIHATPTGMADHPGTALDPDLLRPGVWVADIVYRPLATQLLEAARERGCRTLDGGRMAVFQAVHAFELFTGLEPHVDRMLAHFNELTAQEGATWTRA